MNGGSRCGLVRRNLQDFIANAALVSGIDRLAASSGVLASALASGDGRAQFTSARDLYERVEPMAAALPPSTALALNGPALPFVDEDPPAGEAAPAGFQALETALHGADTLDGVVERISGGTGAGGRANPLRVRAFAGLL